MAGVAPPQPCDLLLSGGFVVTLAKRGQTFWPGSVAIKGRDIVGVGPADDLARKWLPKQTLDCGTHAILPGFVNCHVHAGMSLLKGCVRGPFRKEQVLQALVDAITETAAYTGTRFGCLQMMKSGITTFADMWPFPDANAEAVTGVGMRAVLAPFGRSSTTQELEALASAPARWNNHRLAPAMGVHSLRTSIWGHLRSAAEIALAHDLRIHMQAGVRTPESAGGNSLKDAETLGLLRPGTILADLAHATQPEIDLASKCGAGVALLPVSNAQLGSGNAPLARFKARLPVGLGTDAAGAYGRHDLFDEMRVAVLADRGHGAAANLGPEDALEMATIGGARVLRLDDLIGSLETSKRADIVTIRLDDPRFVPLDRGRPQQLLSHLVFAAAAVDVDTVVVDGHMLVQQGIALHLDEEELIAQAREMSNTVLARAGLS